MKHISKILFLLLITFGSTITWSCSTITCVSTATSVQHFAQRNTILAYHSIHTFSESTHTTYVAKNLTTGEIKVSAIAEDFDFPFPEVFDPEKEIIDMLKERIEEHEQKLNSEIVKGDPQ